MKAINAINTVNNLQKELFGKALINRAVKKFLISILNNENEETSLLFDQIITTNFSVRDFYINNPRIITNQYLSNLSYEIISIDQTLNSVTIKLTGIDLSLVKVAHLFRVLTQEEVSTNRILEDFKKEEFNGHHTYLKLDYHWIEGQPLLYYGFNILKPFLSNLSKTVDLQNIEVRDWH